MKEELHPSVEKKKSLQSSSKQSQHIRLLEGTRHSAKQGEGDVSRPHLITVSQGGPVLSNQLIKQGRTFTNLALRRIGELRENTQSFGLLQIVLQGIYILQPYVPRQVLNRSV